jgi:hypothetical protein
MEKLNETRQLARFTIMLKDAEIREIRHIAVDQRTSASEILRTAVREFLVRNTPEEREVRRITPQARNR